MDHVIPTAAGGKWSWDNLVTACTLCNCRKGSKSVEQLGWKLRKRPQVRPLLMVEVGVMPSTACTCTGWQSEMAPKESRCTSSCSASGSRCLRGSSGLCPAMVRV